MEGIECSRFDNSVIECLLATNLGSNAVKRPETSYYISCYIAKTYTL